jgi:hypothetical protein
MFAARVMGGIWWVQNRIGERITGRRVVNLREKHISRMVINP